MERINENIWRNFVEGIDFNHNLIKEDILNSWKRCKKYGVPLYSFDQSLLMNLKEKDRYILKNLPEYNIHSFKEFYNIVNSLNLNISIYDKNSRLKYIVNYPDNFDQLYPNTGYFKDVSENLIGTNSTCLALIEKRPYMVIGFEHYNYNFHKFSCAAAPFFDSNNNISGTVNASFLHTSVTNDTLNIIYSLARIYENLIYKNTNVNKINNCDSKNTPELFTFNNIIGKSDKMLQLKKVALKASKVASPVLIYGKNGSGKEVFAQSIHTKSNRGSNPFVAINCGAIPKDLIESELFGYEPGAFTGAVKKGKKGLLEYASGGTLFLDEIDSMPLSVQVKLLRALSTSSVMRIGGLQPISIDIRIISASKKDLRDEIEKNNFREDLFYRINVIQLNIPPLKDRKEDIPLIFNNYLNSISKKINIGINSLDDKFIDYLKAYHWPGNVRQLINIVERSLVFSENGCISTSLLPSEIKESYTLSKLRKDFNKVFDNPLPDGKNLLEIAEEVIIERVLKEENNNLSKTAIRLGMSRPTLYKKIKKSNRLNCKDN